jgi:hypothetical protein
LSGARSLSALPDAFLVSAFFGAIAIAIGA